jgi:hypothetical protein
MPEEEDDGVENVDARNQSSANDPPPPKKRARFTKECEVIKRRAGLGRECEVTGNIMNTSQEVTEVIPKVLKVEPGQEDNDQDHNNEDVPMFPCHDCTKRFSNAGSLLIHSEEHEKKTWKKKCPMCNVTGTRLSLLSHIRAKHTKEKLFSCAFCKQLFTTCAYKNRHEKIKKHFKLVNKNVYPTCACQGSKYGCKNCSVVHSASSCSLPALTRIAMRRSRNTSNWLTKMYIRPVPAKDPNMDSKTSLNATGWRHVSPQQH